MLLHHQHWVKVIVETGLSVFLQGLMRGSLGLLIIEHCLAKKQLTILVSI